MPLSDEEQQRLDDIEQALRQDDPEFAANVSMSRLRRRAIIVPGALFLLGAVLLVTGLVTTHALLTVGVIISVAGFLTMTATVALFIQRHHRT